MRTRRFAGGNPTDRLANLATGRPGRIHGAKRVRPPEPERLVGYGTAEWIRCHHEEIPQCRPRADDVDGTGTAAEKTRRGLQHQRGDAGHVGRRGRRPEERARKTAFR